MDLYVPPSLNHLPFLRSHYIIITNCSVYVNEKKHELLINGNHSAKKYKIQSQTAIFFQLTNRKDIPKLITYVYF